MWWIVASILAVGDPNAPELAPPVQVQAGGQPINVDMGHAALLNAPFVAKPAKKFGKINILSLSSAHWEGRDPRRPSGCPGPLAKDPRGHPPRDPVTARNRTKPGLAPGGGEEAVECAGRVQVISHDLAGVVDPIGHRPVRGAGHVEYGVAAIHVQQEAGTTGSVISHDLAGVVDPVGFGMC